MSELRDVVEKYKTMVYGIALTRVANKFDADDIFQEVFITYYRKNKRFRDSEHEKAWLIRVTLLCSKRFISEKSKNKSLSFDESFHKNIVMERDDSDLYLALAKLEDSYKMVLYLYYFESLSVKEISRYLKLSSGAVRMRMSRGRDVLREEYERLVKDGR